MVNFKLADKISLTAHLDSMFKPANLSPTLLIGLLTLTPAFAQDYQPPADRGRQQQADAQGSRGDCLTQALRLLIPEDHTPNTIAAHPTFFFYSEFPRVSFTLSAPGTSEPLYEREMMINTPKIVRVEIPETAPPLEVGKEYVWTVVARCRSVEQIYARASLRRVELSSELEKALLGAKSNEERVRILAQQGLWHDALAAGNGSDSFWRLLADIGVHQLGDLADVPHE
ncbi:MULTISPECIES: DUF928 domain-containing protein [unclassified Coleofasciculus]|uniref:DUF928 domain-containing protein n=1 Tax=unclassified Coleofasciculus TaxID=2692782 RepID=UPI001881F159|nr:MULTISPECIES: DUF928 domain-containing protein [unclassified Coleofasciculus]MBE9130082.1 DUF928 domain-containing protein [Coleofasciculus sp. LEGE 07081]MBE9152436.1 DUF928 domain-containing protein [Coleofasciculus sp. LEGE 07092]